jgi:ssDNA thymidine ADP-ribosyltransferase, DarT
VSVPAKPKVYHITHIGNLAAIIAAGCLWSDAKRIAMGLDCTIVGMSSIKKRRLEILDVSCHPHTKVGDYVPFYFCPRSIMLYILHVRNHPELAYRDGQQPIVHLQADLNTAVAWANGSGIPWVFSDRNAGASVAQFFNTTNDLHRINWTAVAATDFRDPVIKEGKQAEFLTHGSFPWALIEKVGVIDGDMKAQVDRIVASDARHNPVVAIERTWYF